MKKRTPGQILQAIHAWGGPQIDAEIDAEMERVLAMTPEQVEAELRAAGVDVEADDAKGLEAYERVRRGEAPARKRPLE